MKRALIIDGNSLIYRVYYATINQLDYFKEYNQTPNNALKLMIDLCFKLKNSKEYSYGIIAFDCGGCKFRTDLVESYKANRSKMPEELRVQLLPTQEILELIGFNVITKPGFEADDIIGSCSKLLSKHNVAVDIYSSDRDMLQLIDSNISVNLIKKGLKDIVIHTNDNLNELIGLKPLEVIDYKAIVGDSADNISGIKGIGPKAGLELINKYSTVENIIQNIDNLSPKIKEKISSNIELLLNLKTIISIKTNLYDHLPIDSFLFNKIKTEQIKTFLNEWKINGMEKYL